MTVKPFIGLEVVIPRNFPRKQIPGILQQHADWITQQLRKHEHTFHRLNLPGTLNLALTGQHLQIDYQPLCAVNKNSGYRLLGEQLTIYYLQHQDAIDQLRDWLRYTAKHELAARLKTVADELGFHYRKVSVRSQKSRWGSCSSKGTISLNDQLMFLPADSVRYLMIHELCHTQHMNHSQRFWQLVQTCCPQFRQHEQVLNNGRQMVPDWFLQDLYNSR